ncbi:Y-family DNA polymerase [Corynebacterium tapiri]|uniref:DNA polymerase Y family protein n=1 Tax=Corynebacterium tapiri TaxID=1448266 RepID=A0A5C4U4J5_9CORY|nr:DNA polymerase Y family protein [Corynebacterium tapiri]TNL98491.1 DNA polymerase Y family protein [Corynebacterium tapiri]
MKVAALWFPDWPCQAVSVESKIVGPVAVNKNHRVRTCSSSARARGVRRGMKARQAQAVCPELTIVDDDPDRDGRVFAPIVDGLDDVASSVEVLRPGLVVVDLGAAERFHGARATEMLIDAAARQGVDAFAGVAGEIATAVLAARSQAVVENSPAFLHGQPLHLLVAEEALGCDVGVVNSLRDVGITTLGDLAALPAAAVSARFGAAGMRCRDIARAAPDRRVAPAIDAPDLTVSLCPEDPLTRVDEAAFIARSLAAQLHERLSAQAASCRRLRVRVELVGGEELERVWRTREALTESATADRVRWQLDGWLSTGGQAAVRLLELTPLEVGEPEQPRLFGNSTGGEDAHRVIARVQSTLGIEAVVQPRRVGGYGVSERVEYVPYGERRDPLPPAPWPGQIPHPLPARLGGGPHHPASRIRLIDASAADIYVTAEALLSSVPYALGWGKNRYLVVAWAGPWPYEGKWWKKDERVARLQVVGQDAQGNPRAWLLAWVKRSWRVEATYA